MRTFFLELDQFISEHWLRSQSSEHKVRTLKFITGINNRAVEFTLSTFFGRLLAAFPLEPFTKSSMYRFLSMGN